MERIPIPGSRDVRAVLDGAGADRAVVACPPHPQMGGSRSDQRLQAVGETLADHDIACLRFDYGRWDEGRGERRDCLATIQWARERFDAVSLFGYSFGAAVALLAAAEADPQPAAVSVLAPPARLDDSTETPPAVGEIEGPLQIVYGERDDTVDWRPVVDAARGRGATVEALPADHHFVGQGEQVGRLVATFVSDHWAGGEGHSG